VLEGGYTEWLGSKARERRRSSVAFHPPGEEHSETFDRARARTLGVALSPRWLEHIRAGSIRLDRPMQWAGGPTRWILERLHRELAAAGDASPLVIEGLVLELAGEAGRARAERRPPAWLRAVEERLRADFRGQHSLSELAGEVGVHPVHLARAFRRWYRCTCGELVRGLRVQHAAERLAESDAPLSAVALEAGFCDQSHLTRCFKRATGLTPAAYRSRSRGR
jgi:AraC family transcriptional regulator